MSTQRKKTGLKFILLGGIFIPILMVLSFIGLNSDYLIKLPFLVLIVIILLLMIGLLIYGIVTYIKNRNNSRRKLKKWVKKVLSIFFIIYILCNVAFIVLLYGPNKSFKSWLITTAMQTMNHQYLCKWFYNSDDIAEIMDNNYIKESGESTNANLIKKRKKKSYDNIYEKEILDVDDDTEYKIIELNVNGCDGYLAAIYDPSKVKLGVTNKVGISGEYVTQMADNEDALLAINGGGFVDPNYSSTGGQPNGITIKDNEIITNNTYGSFTSSGGIIGFNEDNILVLLKNTSAQESIKMGIRDAISHGPFLIVNGKASFIKGNGGWGYAARTAIGQREDGIVLFLVINSNSTRTKGADMVDLTEIMQKYGAVNAANLDGGTSSVMVLPKKLAQSKYKAPCKDKYNETYCVINDPINGDLLHKTRAIATSWVVTK